ncbi:metal-dependent hydrolase [Paenibacillus xerothermodurans]|uniref:Metal-dependent hydrolase n=1 Tax=Paenibacillus xerothermodurans TaxID=1977292 RepID=A0A2W1NXU6_PAEXE|nr:metal-dependent hydrolase [Paenibacillus xerothermodurans]PZE20442.1 metal-dependent hydrolase [Paenibacillus xerothermodurans]
MDTITHTLFGLTLYAAVPKPDWNRKQKAALFVTAVGGSQIPDIDVISAWWDTAGRYQMWHRGLTHSVFLVPLWAALLSAISWLFWRVKSWRLYGMGALAVFIHDTSDLFNAWGTGYFEPFSQNRITFGTIPIVDLTFWAIMLGGLLYSKLRRVQQPYRVYRWVWVLMLVHITVQSAQGYALYHQYAGKYDQFALAAEFVPTQFQMIGKKDGIVEISKASVLSQPTLLTTLTSQDDADLDKLFASNPRAKTLYEWSPFVVVVDDQQQLGIYDPRFYRDGQSFLFESIEKELPAAS